MKINNPILWIIVVVILIGGAVLILDSVLQLFTYSEYDSEGNKHAPEFAYALLGGVVLLLYFVFRKKKSG